MRYGKINNAVYKVSNRTKTATGVLVDWEWDNDWNNDLNGIQMLSIAIFKRKMSSQMVASTKDDLKNHIDKAIQILEALDLNSFTDSVKYYQSRCYFIAQTALHHYQFYISKDECVLEFMNKSDIELKDYIINAVDFETVSKAHIKMINKLKSFKKSLKEMI